MATGTNLTTDIDQAVRPMLAATMMTNEQAVVMKPLVRKVTLEKNAGGTYQEPKLGTFADAQDLDEGIAVTQSQKMSDTLLTSTPTEIGHKVVITKRAVDTRRDNLLRQIGVLAGNSMARKEDKTGLLMLDGFSNSLVGAGNPVTAAHVGAAVTAIKAGTTGSAGALANGEPPPKNSPISVVLHPNQMWPLKKNIAAGVGTYPVPSGISEQVLKSSVLPAGLWGVTGGFHEAGNLTIDSSDDAKGGIFAKDALLIVDSEVDSRSRYDDDLRAYVVVQTKWQSWGEYSDAWGREIAADASIATS